VADRSAVGAVLVFLAACVVCVVGYLFLLSVVAGGATRSWSAVAPALCLSVALLALNARFLHRDGLSLASLGLAHPSRRAAEFLVAFVAAGALVALWAITLTLVAGVSWQVDSGFALGGAVGLVAFTFFNNAAEELAYRGWLFLRLQSDFGAAVAVIAPTVIFAAAHVQGGVPWPNAVAGVFTTGIILALLFHRTRSVPLVLGFHLATNVFQEVLGLRQGGATILSPHFRAGVTATEGYLILAIVAAINLAVAWIVWRFLRSYDRTSRAAASA